MRIEFDRTKDIQNRRKHGLSLEFAAELDWDAMQMRLDDSHDYGEERWLGVASAGGELYAVVFTLRDDDETIRVISLRRASTAEVRRYETQSRK